MPKISIIVPVYKVEEYLPRCIDSILDQTFTDFELILIDDGSPDNCGAICDEYAKKDRRIVVIHKDNAGVSSARNDGLEISKGEYILFCDSDDFVSKEWCKIMYEIISQSNIDLGICGYSYCDINGNIANSKIVFNNNNLFVEKKNFFSLYMNNLINMPWNKIYRKKIITESRIFFDESIDYNEDLLFVLHYIQCCKGDFAVVNEALNYYRTGIDGSLTKKYVENFWNIKKKVFCEIKKTIDYCNIDFNKVKYDYYSKWNWSIVMAISNNYKSGLSKKQIKKLNKEILESDECKIAFKNGGFYYESKFYQMILRTRNYIIVDLFNSIAKLRKS